MLTRSKRDPLGLRFFRSGPPQDMLYLQQFFLQAEENETMKPLSKRSWTGGPTCERKLNNYFLDKIGQIYGEAQRIARRLWEIDNELESNELLALEVASPDLWNWQRKEVNALDLWNLARM